MGQMVVVSDLRPGDRLWVGDDSRLVVAAADEGAVVARLPRDTRFELCRDREVRGDGRANRPG